MKKRRNIIIIISIVVCIATGIFMFNEHSELKYKLEQTQSSEEVTLAKKHEFLKDGFLTILSGGSIYCIFYAIPHDYKELQKKEGKN